MLFQQQFMPPWGFTPFPQFPVKDEIDVINYTSPSTPGPPGPPGPQGPPGSLILPTTTVEGDYVALDTDYFIGVITGDSYSITLPSGPEGRAFIVKDILGEASTNPITITDGGLIDGAANTVINTDFGSLTFVYSNGGWSIV
jgi:hypothetical protein